MMAIKNNASMGEGWMGNRMKKLAIIGGGAAGLAAAVTAARDLRSRRVDDVEVVLYEADDRLGRSILATGNGRCNFSNAHIDAALYHHAAFVGEALEALHRTCAATACDEVASAGDAVHEFFASLGLVWREESEGRLYPLANKATSVLEVLRAAANDYSVVTACNRRVVRIDAPVRAGKRFAVRFEGGVVEHPDAVIVAVGGRTSHNLTLPDSLACVSGRFVLGPLRTDTKMVKHLNNTRVRCAVSLVAQDGSLKAREEGELLFREYGVSGIAVFNLSRFAQPNDTLLVDLLPSVSEGVCEGFLHDRRARLVVDGRPLTCEAILRGLVLSQVADAVLNESGLSTEAAFGEADVPALAHVLKNLQLTVRGIGEARQCQVTRGGYALDAVDPCTMEAREVRGLYLSGEALDVDAPCGGFNLHWAWASGILAGRAAASRLAEGGSHA